jgi:ribosome-associated translation inhibitor RaiA
MQVQINTDHSVKVQESESAYLLGVVEDTLSRFEKDITRVEMHLSDENGTKGGPGDKRCLLEARLKGHQPLAVSHVAGSLISAVEGAAEKLARSIKSDVGRRAVINKHRANPQLDEPEIEDE